MIKQSLLLFAGFLLGAFSVHSFWSEIDETDIWHASKIIGVDFSHQETDSLLRGVNNLRNAILENRDADLPNSIRPALYFNPLPPGFEPETSQEIIRYSDETPPKMPVDQNELAYYTVGQLGALVKSRQISSLELTRFFLNRLKKYDPELHCVISLTEDLAIAQARRADAEIAAGNYRGPLHGIPYGAKDLLATKEYRTTWGAMPYREQAFDYDATVVQKLEEAGAVLVAKLSLGALAWGDVWYGAKTRNPWNPETGSSGSSAGSASAVSAGLVPFAIGTETMGSIVSPSTVCGVTGLRPTFGRVSKHGAMALSWSMDKIGPICRTVEDCAMVFDAIRGPDQKDLSVLSAAFNYDAGADVRQLRIGYLKEAFEGDYPFKKQDAESLRELREAGFQLIPVSLPPLGNLRMILSAEAAAAFDELTLSGADDQMVRQIRNAWPNVFREARFIPAVEYIKANRMRTQLIAEMDKIFQDVDLYIHPSWAGGSLQITNFTGHPCVVMPNGFRENGLPSSISLTGKLFGEAELLQVAKVLQEKTDFHQQHPNLH